MSYLDRIAPFASPDRSRYLSFRIDREEIGLIRKGFAEHLRAFPTVFQISDSAVDLHQSLRTFEDRTAAIDAVLRRLAEDGLIRGWRDEAYAVGTSTAAPALFKMERAAVPLFGVRAYGVHVNGYVGEGERMHIWVGRRSLTRFTAPGKLDQLVAGGHPEGNELIDTLINEAAEEASVPSDLARQAIPAGAVSYTIERPEGLRRDSLFVYDLAVPPEFRPVNTDGEIETFYLWPLERVMETVRETDDYKFNCALVVIDFLIRHGFIGPDHPEHSDLLEALRS